MRPEGEREYVEDVPGRSASWHRTAFALCGDSHRADDIVQATIAALYFHWKKVSRVENIDGYVRRILVRRYMDERRRRWSKVQLHMSVPDGEAGGAADQQIADRDKLLTALRALPKGQRAVLV